jgi:adenylate cyclase class 2
MTDSRLEREIKLPFSDPAEARAAVLGAGATLLRGRRLQEDCLLDTADEILHCRRCVLRVRMECGKSFVTFKGPAQPASMKVREELETMVNDGELLLRVFEEIGFRVWFRYQKYREEYTHEDVIIAIDETPVGTFIEIEGSERGITRMAEALVRTPADYITDSYHSLYARYCRQHGVAETDMLFEETANE